MTAQWPQTAAVLVAAGVGSRAGGAVPKQFRSLAGKPLLAWSLERFDAHPAFRHIALILPAPLPSSWDDIKKSTKLLAPIAGGATRQASVHNGLEALTPMALDRVLIHDAARPFPTLALIDRVLAALNDVPAAVPSLPVSDTLKRGEGARITGTVDRAGLFAAQTPQGFHFQAILEAHRRFTGAEMTDDAALAEAAGLPVALVAGDPQNIKITVPEDFALAEAMIERHVRAGISVSGQGFDVHRLVPGDGVWLCGVKIPAPLSLLGHSDADCGLHALTDAVLGAIGAGDIGTHFPPSDGRWNAAPSEQFLRHALRLAAEAQAKLVHVDVTIIAERPKIAPHREAMRARLAELTHLPLARASVKATTTEGLGFTGRGEGIAAQAIATLLIAPSSTSSS